MLDIFRDPYLVGLVIVAVVVNLAALGLKMQRKFERSHPQR